MGDESEVQADVPQIDVDEKLTHFQKHMQRLPWAAQHMDPTPGGIKQFVNDWLVPLFSDLQHVVVGAYALSDEMAERVDEQDEAIEEFIDTSSEQIGAALAMARSTMLGEALALLHMHYKTLHGHLLTTLSPTDPASFALTEMHEVFVRMGMEPPVGTPGDDAVPSEPTAS